MCCLNICLAQPTHGTEKPYFRHVVFCFFPFASPKDNDAKTQQSHVQRKVIKAMGCRTVLSSHWQKFIGRRQER